MITLTDEKIQYYKSKAVRINKEGDDHGLIIDCLNELIEEILNIHIFEDTKYAEATNESSYDLYIGYEEEDKIITSDILKPGEQKLVKIKL